MRPNELDLLGIDVGYSKKRASTGVARCGPAGLKIGVARTDWQSRKSIIGFGVKFDRAAIDGPLTPLEESSEIERACERHFVRKPFHDRCKPGLSHAGQGLEFRKASRETRRQIEAASLIKESQLRAGLQLGDLPIVEAFPNAFIGVMLPDGAFDKQLKFKRGHRFDWLYEQAKRRGIFRRLMNELEWVDDPLSDALQSETHHEKRAALVCLLTAGCAASGRAVMFGDRQCGHFCLPPLSLWEPWSRHAVEAHALCVSLGDCALHDVTRPAA